MNEKLIGMKLAQLRKSKDLSQSELAARIHMSAQSVSKWERGEGLPDVLMLEKLAQVLEVTPSYFFNEEQEVLPSQEPEKKKAKKRSLLNLNVWKKLDFSNTKIENMDFRFASFTDCNFDRAKLANGEFPYSEFTRCTFSGADLKETLWKHADIKKSDFSGAFMEKSFALTSDFIDCRYDGARWSNAEIRTTDFKRCVFNNTEIVGCDFKLCSFSKTAFTGCTVKNSTFIACDLKKFSLLAVRWIK